jgi:hypothetical protein
VMTTTAPPDAAASPAAPATASRDDERVEQRNFLALLVYQVVMRSGWIFKTESIIMPAVLDLISGGAPWARQMLPLLNRLGQSVPPMLMARRVKISPLKSRTLFSTTLVMAACFGLLGGLWHLIGARSPAWMTWIFLAFYGLFFAAMGVNQLVFSTTQGKLIPIRKRGRMLAISNMVGSLTAVTLAFLLLPRWLAEDSMNVLAIFGFACGCFCLSAVATLFLRESPDGYQQPPQTAWQHLADAWRPFQSDKNFRRLALVAASYGVSLLLFPHYQAVARIDMKLPLDQLLWWLILQNLGVGVFGLILGPVADRYGNRLVLNLLMIGLCGAPALSLLLSWYGQSLPWMYNFVFILVGLTPITIKTLHNYTLEICPPSEHPRYLSSLSLWMAAPLLLMPPLGLFLKHERLDALFMGGIGLLLVGWWLTFKLSEPRHRRAAPPPPVETDEL